MGNTSALWESLTASLFSSVDEEFVASFRRPGGPNNRLAAWDPFDKTMRYFKFLLFKCAIQQPPQFFEFYRSLNGVDIGDPVSIDVRGCRINMDHLFSVEEFMFVAENMPLAELETVVEIGAGFGRTCHAFVSLAPQLKQYTIVDLSNVLTLSKAVLQQVVPEHFDKIKFIDAANTLEWRNLSADLTINIDSFQEMPPDTITTYMNDIVVNGRYFYVKNPTGKYRPESIGIDTDNPSRFQDVFSLGLCREVMDIFNEASLEISRLKYLEAYRPKSGTLIADKPLNLFPYYHHALYRMA